MASRPQAITATMNGARALRWKTVTPMAMKYSSQTA